MTVFSLGQDQLCSEKLVQMSESPAYGKYQLSPTRSQTLINDRQRINQALDSGDTHYGINTGFGYLSNVTIPKPQLAQLQLNLLRSHACGTGAYLEAPLVRGLLLMRAHSFALGGTGISLECVEQILEFLRCDILPAIPEKGSVGASGDLAPLAHLALSLVGEGGVIEATEVVTTAQVLGKHGLKPYELKAKEGLSLINGTHFMAVLGAYAVEEAGRLARAADAVAALSLSGFRGSMAPFDARIHMLRPQRGQALVADGFRSFFAAGDEILESHSDCDRVQDPYSFRCIPQVHGAVRDTLGFVKGVVDIELNSVTDNPLCFEDGAVISGGNFHGQPIAMGLDYLAIAMAELGSISERRIEKLTNPSMSNLPAFVMRESGVNSGFMIPHVVAAALVSENKGLAHPASVDSIPTSADKEDHVSMGPIAGRQARQIISNVSEVLAIEALTACQAIDLLSPLSPNPRLKHLYEAVRELSPALNTDRSLHHDIQKVATWLKAGGVDDLAGLYTDQLSNQQCS